jgi:hypothetical protein
MHFDSAHVSAELGPRNLRQTKIDGRGIQHIERLGQFQAKRLVTIQWASLCDEHSRKIAKNTPVARLVGVSQHVARDATTKTHVIQLGLLRARTSFDIAQTFPPSELRESQTEKLIPAGETLDFVIASVRVDTPAKFRQR